MSFAHAVTFVALSVAVGSYLFWAGVFAFELINRNR